MVVWGIFAKFAEIAFLGVGCPVFGPGNRLLRGTLRVLVFMAGVGRAGGVDGGVDWSDRSDGSDLADLVGESYELVGSVGGAWRGRWFY